MLFVHFHYFLCHGFYQELVVALHGLVMQFETNFGVVALQFLEEDRQKENAPSAAAITASGWIVVGPGQPSGMESAMHSTPSSGGKNTRGLRASFSTSHLNAFGTNQPVITGENFHFTSVYYDNSSSGRNQNLISVGITAL